MYLLAFDVWGIIRTLLMVVFILSALLLVLVVLLQEPKGGGLSSAFGGAGAETFGVQTGSVNKFTAWVAGIFMAAALLYAAAGKAGHDTSRLQFEKPAPAESPTDPGTPPGDGGNGN